MSPDTRMSHGSGAGNVAHDAGRQAKSWVLGTNDPESRGSGAGTAPLLRKSRTVIWTAATDVSPHT